MYTKYDASATRYHGTISANGNPHGRSAGRDSHQSAQAGAQAQQMQGVGRLVKDNVASSKSDGQREELPPQSKKRRAAVLVCEGQQQEENDVDERPCKRQALQPLSSRSVLSPSRIPSTQPSPSPRSCVSWKRPWNEKALRKRISDVITTRSLSVSA